MGRVILFVFALFMAAGAAHAQPITLSAADGVKVYAHYWPAQARDAPLILAFHQAGASHAEYTPLAPRLNQAGFSVLAIDQRSGGNEFGGTNRTVAALGRSDSYDAALADLEAALAWGREHVAGARPIVWGSSYSAALVFVLAARHPTEVKAVLAFSPDEYLGNPEAVQQAARTLKMPVFIDQATDGAEVAASRALFDVIPGSAKTLFIARTNGVHGAATLRDDRNAAGAAENWAAVKAFLATLK
ncbi:alpha/beta fold hydrolase [Variovorax sp. H27-G14]|uniref:alpha/beta hydrolase n=1 Tax=Variovorax sp. H27-G14 TaxID=3111914 RepID=UPI0038FC67E9